MNFRLKKLAYGLVLFVALATPTLFKATPAAAATLYWVGSDGANASVASNWNTTNPAGCGAGDSGAAPTSSDDLVFDADCDNGATLDASFADTVASITINAGYTGTVTQGKDIQLTGNFTQAAGVYDAGANDLDIDGSFSISSTANFTAPSTLMTIYDDFTAGAGVTFDANGGIIRFDSDGLNTVSSENVVITCNGVTFNEVQLHNSGTVITPPFGFKGGSAVINSGCTLPLGEDPTIGEYDQPVGVWQVYGTLSGTGTASIEATYPDNGNFRCRSNTCLTGFTRLNSIPTFDIYSGVTLDLSAFDSWYMYGAMQGWDGTATLIAPDNLYVHAGLFPYGASFQHNNGTVHFRGYYDPTDADSFIYSYTWCEDWDFNSVVIDMISVDRQFEFDIRSGQACDLPIGSNPTTDGIIYFNDTAFTGSSGSWTHTGSLSFDENSTVSLDANTLTTFSAISVTDDLTIQTSSGGDEPFDYSGLASLTVGGDFYAYGNSETYPVTFSAPTTINLAGNLLFDAESTFTQASTGTLNLNGLNQTIGLASGGLTTYNIGSLRKVATQTDRLNVVAGTTLNVSGNMTFAGASSSQLLTLQSTNPGSQWYIAPTSNRSANYLQVRDSNNTTATNINAFGSIDNGNNINWFFLPEVDSGVFINLLRPTNQQYVANQRPTFAWRPPDDSQTLFNLVKDYTLTLSNDTGQKFKIESIQSAPPSDEDWRQTDTYRVTYANWDDDDLSNNQVAIYTRTDDSWPNEMNDGLLEDGAYNWEVKLAMNSGQTYYFDRGFYVDLTAPVVQDFRVNDQAVQGSSITTSSQTVQLTGRVTDVRRGEDPAASGPKSLKASIYAVVSNGTESLLSQSSQSFSTTYWTDSGQEITNNALNTADKFAPFSVSFADPLAVGQYRLVLETEDTAGNKAQTSYTYLVQADTVSLPPVGGIPSPSPQLSPDPSPSPSSSPTPSPTPMVTSPSPTVFPTATPFVTPTTTSTPPDEVSTTDPVATLTNNPGVTRRTSQTRLEQRQGQIQAASVVVLGVATTAVASVGAATASGGSVAGAATAARVIGGLKTFGMIPLGSRVSLVVTNDGSPASFTRVEWKIRVGGRVHTEFVTTDAQGYFSSLALPKSTYSLSIQDPRFIFPTKRQRPPGLAPVDFYQGEEFSQAVAKQAPSILIPVDSKVGVAQQKNRRITLFSFGSLLARFTKGIWILSIIYNIGLLILNPSLSVLLMLAVLLIPSVPFIKQYLMLKRIKGTVSGISRENVLVRWYMPSGEPVGISSVSKNGSFTIQAEPGKYVALAIPKDMRTVQQPTHFSVPADAELEISV